MLISASTLSGLSPSSAYKALDSPLSSLVQFVGPIVRRGRHPRNHP